MRTVAVVNQKGGVGKTTTTVNIGHALARKGHRVVMLDLDPQGHLAASLGHYKDEGLGIDRVLLHGASLNDQWLSIRDWCQLVPSGSDLADFEQLPGGSERAYRLRDAIEQAAPEADIMLIDCPPSSGMLIVNAVAAANDVLIPVAGDFLSLTGLARLMLTVKRLKPLAQPDLRKWIFMSRLVARRRLSREVYEKIRQHFSFSLLGASISEAAALAECAGSGKSIFEYRMRSKSAAEFEALADDLLNERVVAHEQENTSDVA
jgi:chromosome partitioning protein